MQRVPLTKAGYARLESELGHLKNVERPHVIEDISTAREHGDLSENAEYHAARERQSFVEGRISELEHALSVADVVDTAKLSGERVVFGMCVDILDEETEMAQTFQIVGVLEAKIEEGRLSVESPLSRALIGKSVGDHVEVDTPTGLRCYQILKAYSPKG